MEYPALIKAMKKVISEYWTKNVPGIDKGWGYTPEELGFYTQVDCDRYRYDSYIPDLLDEIALPGKKILEIGCGLGTDTRLMASLGANVISIDLSLGNVMLTNKGMMLSGYPPQAYIGDAEQLEFPENSFDAVYSFGVLHHTPNTGRAIEEIRRVLKPGGKAIIMLYHKGWAWWYLLFRYGWWDKHYMNHYDNTPLTKMYSKREIRYLFDRYYKVDIEIRTFGGSQRVWYGRIIYNILNSSKFLMNRFGSFAIIRTTA